MKLIKLEQDGNPAWINTDHVLIVIPTKMIGRTSLALVGGVSFVADGTAQEVVNKLNDTGPSLLL
jgi:uncharacterized protein YlzI (FlbEa/FlbD family)